LLIRVSPSFAQQSPLDQHITVQLGALVLQNINQIVQIEQLQAQLTQAQARIKELEAKYEPKPESAK
jgi:hypothetical protein